MSTVRRLILVSLLGLAATAGRSPAFAQAPEAVPRPQVAPARVDSAARAELAAAFELYREFLALPNDAHNPADVLRVVAWLERAFGERGFETARLETSGLPLLLAMRRHPGAERTVLVYLQADGQPVDPAAWDQESPWTPVLKAPGPDGAWRPVPWERLERSLSGAGPDPDWRVFARSAADSKGPIVQFLAALDALRRLGVTPDFHLKVIVDMEEELGSPPLPDAVERYRSRLDADMLVIFDGPPHASGRPTLTFGARGIATATLTTYGPRVPQHSGHYGNWVPNPAFRMAELLASMKDDAGRVTIAGWYDGIAIPDSVRAVLAAVPDDEPALRAKMGIAVSDSVAPSLQEAIQYPSLNVRGLRSGWVGEEARTIIPARAVAEIDVRLVEETDPQRLLGLLEDHVRGAGYHVVSGRDPTEEERARHPRLARLDTEISYDAYRTAFGSNVGRWLTAALTARHGHPPIRLRTSGGSIPISPFVNTLDVPAVSVPTVNPDNNQHSPNENLRVGDFIRGIGTIATVLATPLPE